MCKTDHVLFAESVPHLKKVKWTHKIFTHYGYGGHMMYKELKVYTFMNKHILIYKQLSVLI